MAVANDLSEFAPIIFFAKGGLTESSAQTVISSDGVASKERQRDLTYLPRSGLSSLSHHIFQSQEAVLRNCISCVAANA